MGFTLWLCQKFANLKMAILTKGGEFVPFSNRMVMFQFVFKGQKKP